MNIKLIKLETRTDAAYPQEDKYPSGNCIAIGHMWEHTFPEKGKMFYVWINKVTPKFRTSFVEEIISSSEDEIVFKTENSLYKILIEE